MTTSNKGTILVIGGNGKTGSRVANKLNALGWPVKTASRSSEIKFDWLDATTWSKALEGINAVYITYQPDLAVPGATTAIATLCKLAAEAGVQKLVLLSGRGEREAEECERIVMQSGIQWTVVRASWFAQNFSEGNFLEPVMAGYVALPTGSVREPFIDADDIADVAIAALTGHKHNGKIYEVTGPEAITFREAVAEIAKATGREIVYQQITMEDYAAELADYEVPADVIWLITYLFTEVLDGRNEQPMNGVQEALGRPPASFATYVKKAAEAGAWR